MNQKSVSREMYLLPNLFTSLNLSAGVMAIIYATNGQFIIAAQCIFVAMILDTMDGRIARMTNTMSLFGEQYDSLADVISFGLAPAILMYHWSLYELTEFGRPPSMAWAVAVCYVVCTALRLARFNVQIGSVDKRFFVGLPCPAAAGVMAGLVWAGNDLGFKGNQLPWFSLFITLSMACLMISNVLYYSFKKMTGLRTSLITLFCVTTVVVVICALIIRYSGLARASYLVFFVYACSGPVMWLLSYRKRKFRREKDELAKEDSHASQSAQEEDKSQSDAP